MTNRDLKLLADQLKNPTVSNAAKLEALYNEQDEYIRSLDNAKAINIQNKIDELIKKDVK